MKKLYSLILLLIVSFLINAHPFHVSVTQINYKDKSLQIAIKIFVEDLENAFKNQGFVKTNLGEENENKESNSIINKYLSDKFKVKINNENQNLKLVGKEVEKDAVWIFLEVNNIKKIASIEIYNSILTEQIESQANLIHCDVNNIKKSLTLNKINTRGRLVFNANSSQ